MLDKFMHVNSKGEVFDFLEYNIIANYNNLRDFEWTVVQNNDRITSFQRKVTKKKIPFVFALNDKNPNEIKDKFFEHFEYDVVMNQPGYFVINDYRYYCYAIKSAKTEYLKSSKYLKITLETVSDKSYWKKETLHVLDFTKSENKESDSLTYSFTYPFTYRNTKTSILNNTFMNNACIIRIYGEAVNPLVKIGDNVYQVNDRISDKEYIEINTDEKTIYKYSNFGEKTNLFDKRNKNYDVFKQIQSGQNTVGVNSNFKVDIVLIEKRSEPKWS